MIISIKFHINNASGFPLYLQLEEQIRLYIRNGDLKKGDPLPTTREVAVELGVNMNTIVRVYRDLQAEGLLILERGRGTFVKVSANEIGGQVSEELDEAAEILSHQGIKDGVSYHEIC